MAERARQRSEIIKKARRRKAQRETESKEEKESKSSSSGSSDESSDDEGVSTPDVSDAEDVDQLLEFDGSAPNHDDEQQQPHDNNDSEREPSCLTVHEELKDEQVEIPKKSISGRNVRKRKTPTRGHDFIRTDSLAFGGSSSDVSDASKYIRKK